MAFIQKIKNAQKSSISSPSKESAQSRNKLQSAVQNFYEEPHAAPTPNSKHSSIRSRNNEDYQQSQPGRVRLHFEHQNDFRSEDSNYRQPRLKDTPFQNKYTPNKIYSQDSQINGISNNLLNMMNSQSSSKSRPKNKKESQNIFYESSSELRMLKFKHYVKIASIVFLSILFIFSAYSLFLVEKFDGVVPQNGYVKNGVLYCDLGYKKLNNTCVVDDDFIDEAHALAHKIIEDLKYKWGDYQCTWNRNVDVVPSFKVAELPNEILRLNPDLDGYTVVAVERKILEFLKDPENQARHMFKLQNQYEQEIVPTEVKFSLKCELQMFVYSWKFVALVLSVLAIATIIYKIRANYILNKTANQIYNRLDRRLNEYQSINITQYLPELKQFGKISDDIWREVERIRVKKGKGKIVAVNANNQLFWKKFK